VATADLRAVPGGRLARCAADLFPGYFAFVMATGALSIAAHLLSLSSLAWALLVTGTIAYLVLWLLTWYGYSGSRHASSRTCTTPRAAPASSP
jgi:hypothetical protein